MRTSARETRGSWRGRTLGSVIMAGAVLAGGVPAAAVPTTAACLARKAREWGKLRQCQAIEHGKILHAKPADPAKCQAKLDARLAILNAQASAAAIACRYEVHGDGTVMDYDTGLQWERKTDDGSVHDRGELHDWSSLERPNGTAFTSFLATLNNGTSSDGQTSDGCFAGHCDWRLPSIGELRTIVDLTAPGCAEGDPCIDQTAFGPTLAFFYWSATTEAPFPIFAWGVTFGGGKGNAFTTIKETTACVRAVRPAL